MQPAAQPAYFQPVAQTPASAPVPQDPALPRAGALETGVETTFVPFMRQADSCNAAVPEMRPSAADRYSPETSCSWPPRLRRFRGNAHLPTGNAGTSCVACGQSADLHDARSGRRVHVHTCRESGAGWTVASLASKNLTLRSLLREGSSESPGTHHRWRLPGDPQGHPATGPAISLECGRQLRDTARCGRSTRLPNRGACRDRPRIPVRRRPASWHRRPGTARPARRVPRSHDRLPVPRGSPRGPRRLLPPACAGCRPRGQCRAVSGDVVRPPPAGHRPQFRAGQLGVLGGPAHGIPAARRPVHPDHGPSGAVTGRSRSRPAAAGHAGAA